MTSSELPISDAVAEFRGALTYAADVPVDDLPSAATEGDLQRLESELGHAVAPSLRELYEVCDGGLVCVSTPLHSVAYIPKILARHRALDEELLDMVGSGFLSGSRPSVDAVPVQYVDGRSLWVVGRGDEVDAVYRYDSRLAAMGEDGTWERVAPSLVRLIQASADLLRAGLVSVERTESGEVALFNYAIGSDKREQMQALLLAQGVAPDPI